MRATLKTSRFRPLHVVPALAGTAPTARLKAELHTRIWVAFFKARFPLCALCVLLCALCVTPHPAAETETTTAAQSDHRQPITNFLAQAEAAFKSAQQAKSTAPSASPTASNTNQLQLAIDLARTAFDYADLAKTDDDREKIANTGIAAAREAIAANPNSAPAHYYLALNIGQVARTKMLGALKLLTEMEAELKTVIFLDPKFDYAGGHRTIGVLYLEAPGFSVGDKTKARANLERAVQLAPEFPDNHLCLLEALLKWKDWRSLQQRLTTYQSLLPTAQAKFTGPDWDYEWSDWTRRLKIIQSKAKKT
jgi:tetratricopeptide (TPR) repeat protein